MKKNIIGILGILFHIHDAKGIEFNYELTLKKIRKYCKVLRLRTFYLNLIFFKC